MENFFTRYTDSSAVFPSFPLVQHNSLGSWDVFLSLFHSLTMLPHPPLIVAIQDPPSRRSVLPTFPGFVSFVPPPPGCPGVAIYVSRALNQHLSCSTVFYDSAEMLSVDVVSPAGLFAFPHCSIRVTSVYLLRTNRPPYRSIPPDRVFPFLSYPHQVLADFNLHHPLADPCRSLSDREFIISTPYFDAAFDVPYHLLNTPGVYTLFPFDTMSRPSVLDLAFANISLSPLVSSWDTPLPSTGSDHVPCVITLKPPAIMQPPPTPHWALLDLEAVGKALDTFTTLPCPVRPMPNSLSRWFEISSSRLTSLLSSHAPSKRPCPRSKPWWSPRLSALRREYHKFTRISRLDPSPLNWSNVKSSRRTYFMAIAWAKKRHWSDFLSTATPRSIRTAKRFAFGRPPQRFPDLPGSSDPAWVAEMLLGHFFPSKPPPPLLLCLTQHEDYTPLTSEAVSRALSKSSNTSTPGPDHILDFVWKSVHRLKPSLLPSLLGPLLAHGFHPPSLTKALGIVLDKPGKPSYDSPSSFRVIVLLRTLSKILERIVASRLSAQTTICSLIHPLQCGSLPGRSTANAALVLQHNVESFHRLRYKVSTLLLDVKGGFDTVESASLLALLRRNGVSPYLVQWVGSFLRDRSCYLTFQGSPCLFAPISVGVPQGSPISPLLFLIYVSSLHLEVPRSLIISYVDDFAVKVASPSYRTNVRLLQKSFSTLKRKASPINISFSVPKTKLIHLRTTRSNEPPCSLPVQLEELFYPQSHLKWLGFIFTPAFDPRSHFSRRYTLANAALATICRLSPPWMGLPPYLSLSLARSLLARILLYGSAVWNPPPSIMGPMSVFWHRVCRWMTNCFSSTNITCLHREACLPPLPVLIRHQRRLAGLRLICSPPEINPAKARLPKSVPTFLPHRAALLAHGKMTPEPYRFFNLEWRSAPERSRNPRYRHNAIMALANTAGALIHDVSVLAPVSLHLTDYLPPVPGVVPSYAHLKLRAKQLFLSDWCATPAPPYYPSPPSTRPHPFMGLGKFVAGRIHQMRSGKSYLAAHSSWDNPDVDTSCTLCSQAPQTLKHAILSCPSSASQRSSHLQGVSDLTPEAPIWSDQQLLIAQAEFIRTTATSFPPGMPPLARSFHTPPSSPPPLYLSTCPWPSSLVSS